MQCRDGEADPRVVAAHGDVREYRVGRCAHGWGEVAARRCGAVVCCAWGGMAAIVREVADTKLLDWEEVEYVAAQRERMTAASGGRARRSRGLCWRSTCWGERGVPVRA
ncbi:hypothetical protein TcBrA4_0064260 [Trypanosoma cruzi]|nr:hypothetical protein TcBrA4_0064260 [Trypanosoma cruzi]